MAYNQYGFQNPYQQQQYNPYQQQRSNLEWIMVPTVSDIEKVSVQPGQKAWVMAQNEAVFALRSADQMGLVQTDMYSFEKYEAKPAAQPAQDWVTRDQMQEAIASAIAELKGAVVNESSGKRNEQQRG